MLRPITGLVLAGGQGSRMGGVDKGLQPFNGVPLALNAVRRLQQQHHGLVDTCVINANRHLDTYENFGVPVCPDTLGGYAGPLAGFLSGLARCQTPYLLTVPCDTPLFPLDLAQRLLQALEGADADLAMAAGPEGSAQVRNQPVFCLLKVSLLSSLVTYTTAGGRKVEAWAIQQHSVAVKFDQPHDDPRAFCNANTWDELRALEH